MGPTVAIEATGNRGLINTAISTLRHGGRLCLQGWYPDDVCFHFHSAHMKEVSILMPCAWGWAKGLARIQQLLIDGKIHIKPLITNEFSCADAAEAYRLISSPGNDALGIILKW
jgi:2-desacetyl-2-hydroxyethyl bacteriochlorophyllide A dehydrogenase